MPDRADGSLHAWAQIALSGVDAVRLHPVRNLVTAACLIVMLVPYVAGVAVARGLHAAAHDAIDAGADVFVRAERFGIPVPVPGAAHDAVSALDGVEAVVPRIVCPLVLGRGGESATLVGLPAGSVPIDADALRGRLFSPGNSHEVVVGASLAEALALDLGSHLPPFYRNAQGERIATVVGIFGEGASPWLGRTLFTSLETAAWIADEDTAVTQLLVTAAADRTPDVARAIERIPAREFVTERTGLRLEATSRDDLEFLLPRELFHREAALHLLYALVFSVGIPVVLVSSGLGHNARRRETGLLRATGWQIDELLVRAAAENVTVAAAGAAASILLAWAWLELAGGAGLGALFLRGDAAIAGAPVPYSLAPGPTLLGLAIAVTVVLIATISSTWSAASASPARSMS